MAFQSTINEIGTTILLPVFVATTVLLWVGLIYMKYTKKTPVEEEPIERIDVSLELTVIMLMFLL